VCLVKSAIFHYQVHVIFCIIQNSFDLSAIIEFGDLRVFVFCVTVKIMYLLFENPVLLFR